MTEYATVDGDTGSPEVQVAMLTQRIKDLTEHLKDTSTTTTAVVVYSCSSVSAAGCCSTWPRRTSRATDR